MYGFLKHIIHNGSLVFDIGANVGTMTEVYLRYTDRVVSVEPVPEFANKLRKRCPTATIVRKAVSAEPQLKIYKYGTLSTAVPDYWWTGRFSYASSDDVVVVDTITLDKMIEEYGDPDYIKVDCEGYDTEAVRTLSTPVPALSFEYTSDAKRSSLECLYYMQSLGEYSYTFIRGGISAAWEEPLSLEDTTIAIEELVEKNPQLWGDILCTL